MSRARNAQAPQVPQAVESEVAVLGSILIDPDALDRIADALAPSDFYIDKNAWIFEAALVLWAQSQQIDIVTLPAELERKGLLEKIGYPYINNLFQQVPSAFNVEAYAQHVADTSLRRGILDDCSALARLAYTGDLPADELADQVDSIVTRRLSSRSTGTIKDSGSVAEVVWRNAEEYARDALPAGAVRWLSTGWGDVNAMLGGWRPGLYVILAASHVGKSWFVDHAAANAADQGKRVAVFSLEMTAESIVERLCLAHAGAAKLDYERGVMPPEKLGRFAKRAAEIAEWDAVWDDRSVSVREIAAVLRRETRRKAVDLVVVDYLGLIEGESGETRNIELGTLSRRLKLLSGELQCPFLVPHQVSDKALQDRKTKRPRSSDAYESGHIYQDADVMLGLYRPELDEPETILKNVMEVELIKDRLGGNAGQSVQLYFDRYGRLANLARRGGVNL